MKILECTHPLVDFQLKYNEEYPPEVSTTSSCGIDLRANTKVLILPHGRSVIPTGVFWDVTAVAEGYVAWMDLRSRSGLAKESGLIVMTGTIDQDYRGEIHVILANMSSRLFTCPKGTKIAQMVLAVTPRPEGFEAITTKKIRGSNGFGSTGLPQQNV